MDYNAPTGSIDPNAGYVGKTSSTLGSKIPPKAAEFTQREIVNAELGAGLTPSNNDLTQLIQAISTGIDLGTFGGTANALTATIPGGVSVPALRQGMTFYGILGATNTAAATLLISAFTTSPGPKAIKKRDGASNPAAADLVSGTLVAFRYDGLVFRYVGLAPSDVAVALGGTIKTPVAVNTSFFVNPTSGSDSSGDGTSGKPWATRQYAYSYVQSGYDARGNMLTFNLAAGTYTDNLFLNGPIAGAPGPSNVVFTGAGASSSMSTTGDCFNVSNGAQATVQNMLLASTSFYGLYAGALSQIVAGAGLTYGTCALAHIGTSGGTIGIAASWTISGNAQNHIFATDSGANVNFAAGILGTLSGSLAFPNGFVDIVHCASLKATGLSFAGPNPTGPKFNVSNNGSIDTGGGGAGYFPGSTAGTTASGGQYT